MLATFVPVDERSATSASPRRTSSDENRIPRMPRRRVVGSTRGAGNAARPTPTLRRRYRGHVSAHPASERARRERSDAKQHSSSRTATSDDATCLGEKAPAHPRVRPLGAWRQHAAPQCRARLRGRHLRCLDCRRLFSRRVGARTRSGRKLFHAVSCHVLFGNAGAGARHRRLRVPRSPRRIRLAGRLCRGRIVWRCSASRSFFSRGFGDMLWHHAPRASRKASTRY